MSENSLTIWLDETQNPDASNHLSLCKADPYLVAFRDSNQCIDYITQTQSNEKKFILLISSPTPSQSLDIFLQLQQEFSNIDSVYVFYPNEMNITKDVQVPSGIYTNIESLCNHLRQVPTIQRRRRKEFLRDDFNLCSLPRSTCPLLSSSTDKTTNRQEAEFMYGQFLRDIMVESESSEEEMIKFCREKFIDNDAELNVIDEFETYYDPINAVFWYTRDTFLYRLLNKALREQDVDTLYSLRYFIKDLHLQLKQKHNSQQESVKSGNLSTTNDMTNQTIETVYRGQLMNNEEFDKKIRYNIGGFFSVSSFLSTTLHKNLAAVYAGKQNNKEISIEQCVLFQIDIDKTINKFPYANISSMSVFEEDEGEILFTMGAVFRIESVDLNNEDVWIVKLKLTSDEDEQLKKLTEHMRQDALCTNPLGNLARLVVEMGKYNLAEKYYLLLLEDHENTADIQALAPVYNNLGYIYNFMNQQTKAIEYYENALSIKLKYLTESDPSLALTYNNLGDLYRRQGDYEKALDYFHKALSIDLNAEKPNPNKIANRYSNIGLVYFHEERYSEALAMFEQCLNIQIEILPSNHPNIATSYNNISQAYNGLGNYEKSLEYLNQTLQIQINSLPSTHPELARSYHNLGHTYNKQGKLREALEMYDKSLKIDRLILPLDHPTIILIYNNISLIYNSLHDYDNAIEYLKPMLEIDLESLSSKHIELARIYHNLADAYYHTNQLEEALDINEKSLKIRLKFLPSNHPDLTASYNNTADVYNLLGNVSKAINYLDQAIQFQLKSDSINYPILASTYNNLAGILYEQENFDEALKLYEKSLEIRLKVLPTDHPDMDVSYINIAHICYEIGYCQDAICYLNKLLQIQMNKLPTDHIDFARTYNKLGLAYDKYGQYEQALTMHNKALEIRLNSLPSNHPDIALSYYNIALLYVKEDYNDKAIEFLNKSLEIELHSLTGNPLDLAKTYDMLARALYEQGKFQESLENIMKCYKINSKYLPPNHPEILNNREQIAFVTIKYEQWRRTNGVLEKQFEKIDLDE